MQPRPQTNEVRSAALRAQASSPAAARELAPSAESPSPGGSYSDIAGYIQLLAEIPASLEAAAAASEPAGGAFNGPVSRADTGAAKQGLHDPARPNVCATAIGGRKQQQVDHSSIFPAAQARTQAAGDTAQSSPAATASQTQQLGKGKQLSLPALATPSAPHAAVGSISGRNSPSSSLANVNGSLRHIPVRHESAGHAGHAPAPSSGARTSGAPTAKQLWDNAATAAHPSLGISAVISIGDFAARASRALVTAATQRQRQPIGDQKGYMSSRKAGSAAAAAGGGSGHQGPRELVPSSITKSQLQEAKVVSQVSCVYYTPAWCSCLFLVHVLCLRFYVGVTIRKAHCFQHL